MKWVANNILASLGIGQIAIAIGLALVFGRSALGLSTIIALGGAFGIGFNWLIRKLGG